MKKRLWMGKWQEGRLVDNDTPFGLPFCSGCDVYFRPCDIGVAAFMETNGKSAIRYLSQYQADTSFSDVQVCHNVEDLNQEFELMREEIKSGAAQDSPIVVEDEVVVPTGIPLVFSTAEVHVGRMLSNLVEPCWLADWYFDKAGRMNIAFEKQILYYAITTKSDSWIEKTLKHETFEARAALRWAKKEYGDISPSEYDTLATQFGGIAHAMTVHVVEGVGSEKLYNSKLAKWVEKADLPRPPYKHELT